MEVKESYSRKGGKAFINAHHPTELIDVIAAIRKADGVRCLCKTSQEKTKNELLFSPVALNDQMKPYLCLLGWRVHAPSSPKGIGRAIASVRQVFVHGIRHLLQDAELRQAGID